MDDENNNLNDTIQNDLENRKNIDSLNKIERAAKQKTKDAAKKGTRKALKSLFKPVTWSSLIGFGPILIIVFFIISVVGFITTMPGLVQEEIMSKILEGATNLKYKINGSDYYLDYLANDTEHTAQKNVLRYLDDMGIDPVGFGFAPFYSRDKATDEVSYDPIIGTEAIEEYGGPVGLMDSLKNNNELAEKVKNEDLIFKYIVSNERTYLVDEKDSMGNVLGGTILGDKFPNLFADKDLTGMIKTYIPGPDDSSISVDRENKQLVIESINLTWDGGPNINIQEAKYNLENWTGRYGMPMEFLLALHIGTMSADITEEMLSNETLDTEVEVLAEKDVYDLSYDIKYEIDGEFVELPFPAQPGGANDDLVGLCDYIRLDDDNKAYIDMSDEQLIDDWENEISINSLEGWINRMGEIDYNFTINMGDYSKVANDAKDTFLGTDQYRVRYELQGDTVADTLAVWRTSSYMGKVLHNDVYAEDGLLYNPYIFADESTAGALSSGVTVWPPEPVENGAYKTEVRISDSYSNSDERIEGNIYTNGRSTAPIDLRDYGFTDQYFDSSTESHATYTTGILHGLDYYINQNANEVVNNEYTRLGILCMLSQIDTYCYLNRIYTYDSNVKFYWAQHTESSSEGDYIEFWDENDNTKVYTYNIPGNMNVNDAMGTLHWNLAYKWLRYMEQNEGNYTYAGVVEELKQLRDEVEYCYNLVDNKGAHIQEVLDDLLKRAYPGDGIQLSIMDISEIYDVLCETARSFEYVQLRIKHVIKHWFKDVVFKDTVVSEDGSVVSVDVYKNIDEDIRLPLEVDNEKLEVTAVLGGGKNYKQVDPPYVVKGDIVMVDGDIVEEPGLSGGYVSTYDGGKYRLGDGYRVTKKLFTQGQYYVFDGTAPTSRSIFYAKELEKLEAGECAEVSVKEGRILTEHKIDSPRGNVIAGSASDPWIIYKEDDVDNPKVAFYCVYANKDLNYVSVGSTDSNIVEKSKESVEKINGMLETMGISTTRKPISFDNTTASGDVTTLTAFGLLAGMHSESAEHIYKDFKEFLIELGYYTKAEFDYLNTKVLDWFIPDYKPETNEERIHWNQVREEDALKYGVMIYPEETNSNGDVTHKGFGPDLAVVAPGNAKIIRKEADIIELEFDASNQPEIGIVDKFVMQITGINVTTSKGVGELVDAKEEIGKTTEKQPIQVVMLNRRGGFVSDVQDYMGPEPKEISLENDYNVDTSSGQNLVTSEEEFRNLFSDYKVIADNASAFIQMQDEYNVNAVFAAAVAIVESSGGVNGTLVGNGNGDPYNMFSVGVWSNSLSDKQFDWTNTSLSHWMRYDSYEQSILDFGNFIVNAPYYFKIGNNTISSIAEHYCPPTAEDWARDVSRIMTERLRQLQ